MMQSTFSMNSPTTLLSPPSLDELDLLDGRIPDPEGWGEVPDSDEYYEFSYDDDDGAVGASMDYEYGWG